MLPNTPRRLRKQPPKMSRLNESVPPPDPSGLTVRQAGLSDITQILAIMDDAREVMRSSGNLHQWTGGYPSFPVIEKDIVAERGFVCVDAAGTLQGYFVFMPSPEPTYAVIYDGAWLDDERPYHVLHRIAGRAGSHGVFRAMLAFAAAREDNLRIDTHRDNRIMQHLVTEAGFSYCGIILLDSGDERLAYQRIR